MKKVLGLVAVLALMVLGAFPATAQASETQFKGWVTWEIPAGGTGDNVKYPQPFIGLGEIGSDKCGVTYQTDYYEGPKAAVEKMWADKLLQHGEDYKYVKKWYFTTGSCVVVKEVQVDTYKNKTAKLAKKAQRYDNDGLLKYREDQPHPKKWQVVKVTGQAGWTSQDWINAINKATTKKGVENVVTTVHKGKVKVGHALTIAWERHGDWKNHPQTFIAQG